MIACQTSDIALSLCIDTERDYETIQEDVIDLLFKDRKKVIEILDKFKYELKYEDIFMELYATIRHDYYYNKMPYVFNDIIKDMVKEAKHNKKLQSLLYYISTKFEL